MVGPEHGGRGTRFLADSPVSVRVEGRLQVQRGRGLGVSGQFCLVTTSGRALRGRCGDEAMLEGALRLRPGRK